MPAPLTNDQKRILSQLARRAFNKLRAQAKGRGEVFPVEHAMHGEPTDPALWCEETFRHEHVARACHKQGLRCCSQDDYAVVKAHFLHLLGEDGQAVRTLVSGGANEKRVADFKLNEAMRAGGFSQNYVETIARRQFHACVADLSAKQTWNLVYTLRNRAAAKKRAAREEAKGATV
jgi:hypothetical protein